MHKNSCKSWLCDLISVSLAQKLWISWRKCKICAFSTINFCFFHRFRAHLSQTKLCYPSVSVNRQQISAGKQHVKAVKVFSKTSIHYLDIAEIPLDNQERIVHFAAGCRLTMFDLFFPVYSIPRSFLWKRLPSAARRGWLALLLKWRFLRTTISHFASKKTPTRGVFCI